MRFIGSTTESTTIKALLSSICLQISVIYSVDPPPKNVTQSAVLITNHFTHLLEQISKRHADKRPLLLVFDNVNSLDPSDRAHTMFWLPGVCPSNVFILLSVDSSHNIYERLQVI